MEYVVAVASAKLRNEFGGRRWRRLGVVEAPSFDEAMHDARARFGCRAWALEAKDWEFLADPARHLKASHAL